MGLLIDLNYRFGQTGKFHLIISSYFIMSMLNLSVLISKIVFDM